MVVRRVPIMVGWLKWGLRVQDGVWGVVSRPVLLLDLLLYLPLSVDALVMDLLGLLWGQP